MIEFIATSAEASVSTGTQKEFRIRVGSRCADIRIWSNFARGAERPPAKEPQTIKDISFANTFENELTSPPFPWVIFNVAVRARAGRQVSETLRAITFRHPALGRVEAFRDVASLPEDVMEGSTFDLNVRLDERGRVLMGLPDKPKVGPSEAKKRLGPESPKFPDDPNDSEAMAKYNKAMSKLLPH